MKTKWFKIAIAAACFALTTAGCNSNSNGTNNGNSTTDEGIAPDTTMTDMDNGTGTMGTDTTGTNTMSDTPGTGSSPTL